MTMILPWRLITLHFSHMGFTDGRTFMILSSYKKLPIHTVFTHFAAASSLFRTKAHIIFYLQIANNAIFFCNCFILRATLAK